MIYSKKKMEEIHKFNYIAVGLEHLTVFGSDKPRACPERHDTVLKGVCKEFACLNKSGTAILLL